jgi:hypothetical protein
MWITLACILGTVWIHHGSPVFDEAYFTILTSLLGAAVISFLLAVIALRSWKGLAVFPLVVVTVLVLRFVFSPGIADDWSAVALLRWINTAEGQYSSSNQGRYGTLPELIAQGLLDPRFAPRLIHGYLFTATPTAEGYTATAIPTSKDAGRFGYYSTADSVIRYATSRTATCDPCFPKGLLGEPVQ